VGVKGLSFIFVHSGAVLFLYYNTLKQAHANVTCLTMNCIDVLVSSWTADDVLLLHVYTRTALRCEKP